MKNYFAENLKKLRLESNITQEKLAEFIGVAPQTISKWEKCETYPDIEKLPIISNYFKVSIDRLLGNDQICTEAEIDLLINKIKETGLRDSSAALEMAKEGYKRYPYSYKMMDTYGDALTLYCPDRDTWDREYCTEVRRIAQLILDGCMEDDLRYSAIEKLCITCGDNMEEYLKACQRIPSGINFTRELWLEDYYKINTDEGIRLRQKNIMEFMWWFISHVNTLCGWREDAEYDSTKADINTWIAVCEMELAIYNGIFSDGDYLEFSWNVAWTYYHLAEAQLEKGEYGKALDCLEKVAEYSSANESLPPFACHTSFLVNKMVYDESKIGLQGSCGSPEDYLEKLSSQKYDVIRNTARFDSLIQKLQNCSKNVKIRDKTEFERFGRILS